MELMTRKQIAQIFYVSAQTIGSWERKKIIQPYCNVAGRPDTVRKMFIN
jgi:DNA-binding XRE family transcriptional regulator